MTSADDDYQSRLRDMVVDRLDEAVSSTHFMHSNEPMVPILRQMCANMQWLVSGANTKSDNVLDSVTALRRLLKEKPRRECDTDRLISLVADALLLHLSSVISTSSKAALPSSPAIPRPFPSSNADSVPAKKARLEAKINGLASKRSDSAKEEKKTLFPDLSSLVKNEPVEIICRVGSSAEMREDESDTNDDSGVMDASGSEDNPLLRLLKEQEGKNGRKADTSVDDGCSLEEEAGDVSGEEESYDFSLLLNGAANVMNDMPQFDDPFVNEPPIFSPSVSTIRKNTRRSKPEKIAEKGCTRVNRDPNAPRQVISAYLCFVGEMRMRRNNGDLHCNGGEFGQLLKSEWIKLPDKSRYEMQHEEDKRRYEAELAAWARSERRPVPGRKAYSFYVLEHFQKMKDENKEMTDEQVIMKVFISWRDLADKAKYFHMQQRDKERYRNEMKLYTARLAQSGINNPSPGQVTITSKQKMNGKELMNTEQFLKQELQLHLKNVAPFAFPSE